MKMYNTRSFRVNIKEAFDSAATEEEVYILRDQMVFKISLARTKNKEDFLKNGIISKNPRPNPGERNE